IEVRLHTYRMIFRRSTWLGNQNDPLGRNIAEVTAQPSKRPGRFRHFLARPIFHRFLGEKHGASYEYVTRIKNSPSAGAVGPACVRSSAVRISRTLDSGQ